MDPGPGVGETSERGPGVGVVPAQWESGTATSGTATTLVAVQRAVTADN